MSQKYDITIKDIFSNMADDITAYFLGLTYTKTDELNIEFTKVEKRQSDIVLKCTTEKGDIAVHLEFQSDNDDKMPYRMLRYSLEIMEKYNLTSYQLVIYMGKNDLKMENKLDYNLGEENILDYRYKIIDVGTIKFLDITKTDYYDVYALLPIMDRERRKTEGEKYLKECVEAIKNIPIDINKKKDITFKAEILSGLVYSREVIERVFTEVMEMLRIEESEAYKMILEKGAKEKSLRIAKELLKEGMDINKIAKITELSIEEIKKLMN
ncbi:Rpn family recombination-promoting nuclease/putative transposase [Thermoanaerobacter siderophilus]|uniref:Transposase (putative) YhgA-like domain-containing protein n=1 Tax=Thermoanaerobacter siderophilus SR4 TaxID=880478 RepID=I9KQV9_9THEO|nr:Rpn family recombination-promoting nuclease/putative transposase [Thermoanaerobacter siderophilus]EIV99268.1 hypothetical protein ThesiDRAFT1_0236 [Thermoanaerobacter siderophilus SR4]